MNILNIDFDLLVRAVALAFCLEGFLWALFPNRMKETMAEIIQHETKLVQTLGLFSIGFGLLILWVMQ